MKNSKSELPIIGKKHKKDKIHSKSKQVNKKLVKNKTNIQLGQNEEEKNIKIPPINEINKFDNKNKKIENLIEEAGIPTAFNLIFSELISKQIMPENFFKYTSLRLKELGKEIARLEVKEPVYIERLNEIIPEKRCKTEGDKVIKNPSFFMTEQHGKVKKPSFKLNDLDKYN